MAVSDMVDHGARVIFDKVDGQDISHFIVKRTGQKVRLHRTKGVYDMYMKVRPYRRGALKKLVGTTFHGQGRGL